MTQASAVGSDVHKEFLALFASIKHRLQIEECGFGILMVGESGSGKSTLVDNLLLTHIDCKVDWMKSSYESQTTEITKYKADVQGVPVVLYDTPGYHSTRGRRQDAKCMKKIRAILDSGEIQLVVFCFRMAEVRMRSGMIHTFEEFHKIGVDWERTVMALTHADALPVPSTEKKKEGFESSQFFNDRLTELQEAITKTLVERVGVKEEFLQNIKFCPTTSDLKECLPNGKQWFIPLWVTILDLLSPEGTLLDKFLAGHMEGTPARASGDGGFTESECHALYQKAVTDNPTITLHIAKAMTIGPPRVGKTSLRHLLLGLPLPEISISTPVMKTAETVGILSSDEMPSLDEYKVSGAVKADSDLIQIGSENDWVLVNETSGIHSLLSHLEESVVKTEHAGRTQEAWMKDSHSALSTLGDLIWPHPQSHFTKSHPKHATIEPEQGKVKQHVTTTSTGATAKDSTQVLAAASQLFQVLQSPNIADITLPDAKLVQFLDCGGQLAYHDILPIFTTIPAIYLHVFDLTKELGSCPEDQLCLDPSEEKVYSPARSPLTVAEMMNRSVMTIKSLADKRVQLPERVLLSDPPKPHIAFVGTHLDELAKKSKNMKPTFDSASKALQIALELESHDVEEMVMTNVDPRLPANFFPVSNKQKMRPDDSRHATTWLKGKVKTLVSQGVSKLPGIGKQNVHSDISRLATKQLKGRIQTLVSGVKVKVPVKWYLYQMLEIGLNKEKCAPVHRYSDLYKSCHLKMVVNDLKEFHTMITYFHALGLLIHACNEDAHSEVSTCLVFTDPSYLFENISKLFHVQFLDTSRCSGSLRRLKLQGKLTEKTLRDLKVDSTQLDHKAFMDVLVHFFIGADIEVGAGNEGRTLFIPSVLPVDDASQPLPNEQSLHFGIAFNEKPFIPCGVYAGVIARLQSLPQWTISTASVSRSHAAFGVAAEDMIELFHCSSHIRVELDACDREKAQEYRDTVLTVVSESYCFLFHAKPTKGQPCATCREEPYLVLGMTCQHCCGEKTNHIATLQVDNGEAKAVRCRATQNARKIHGKHQELFQDIQHDAVVHDQHTSRPTSSRKVMMTLPPQDTAEHTTATSTNPPQNRTKSDKESILLQIVNVRQGHLMLLRKHVSRKAAGKGRAVLEGLWLDAAMVEACFRANPLDDEGAVQAGIIKWIEGNGRQPPTWDILLEVIRFAGIARQDIQNLEKDLGLPQIEDAQL